MKPEVWNQGEAVVVACADSVQRVLCAPLAASGGHQPPWVSVQVWLQATLFLACCSPSEFHITFLYVAISLCPNVSFLIFVLWFFFFFEERFIYFPERVTEREGETKENICHSWVHFPDALTNWLGHLETRNQKFHPGLPRGWKGQGAWPIFHSFPRPLTGSSHRSGTAVPHQRFYGIPMAQ